MLERTRVVMVGAGGLGSWAGLGLVRSGVRNLTIIDPDIFDRTNAHRQLMFPEDLARQKASSLARNLLPHMIAGGTITAISQSFEELIEQGELQADLLLVLVDNNRCRFAASRWARIRSIPAMFAMLSLDGTRMNAFLQGPNDSDACLWCALPNLDPEAVAQCAAATISTCFLASAVILSLIWQAAADANSRSVNWYDINLAGHVLCGTVPPRLKRWNESTNDVTPLLCPRLHDLHFLVDK